MPDDTDPSDSTVDEPQKRIDPSSRYADFVPSAVGIGPKGEAPGFIGQPPAVPAATTEHFVCLRGPCSHYWELETFIAMGNPKDTFDPEIGLKDPLTGEPVKIPNQITRWCTAQPGVETEFTDDVVFACNKWDPMTPREVKRRDKKRAKYLKLHPSERR